MELIELFTFAGAQLEIMAPTLHFSAIGAAHRFYPNFGAGEL